MIGSLLYCIALLATAELELPDNHPHSGVDIPVIQNVVVQETSPITNVITDATQSSDEIEQKIAPITLTNAITPDMLRYKHWTGTYSPEQFDLYINGTKISQGESYTLTDAEQSFIISFDYSFMNGMRKGTKKFSYQMKESSTDATLTFSWLEHYKVLIDNATPIKEIT